MIQLRQTRSRKVKSRFRLRFFARARLRTAGKRAMTGVMSGVVAMLIAVQLGRFSMAIPAELAICWELQASLTGANADSSAIAGNRDAIQHAHPHSHDHELEGGSLEGGAEDPKTTYFKHCKDSLLLVTLETAPVATVTSSVVIVPPEGATPWTGGYAARFANTDLPAPFHPPKFFS